MLMMISVYHGLMTAFLSLLNISPSTSTLWPRGTYGIPADKFGCPFDSIDSSFVWTTGSRLHLTEVGSHSSTNHLVGENEQYSSHVLQRFCMKTNHGTTTDKYNFTPGKYCIFKRHNCPPNFEIGWIYWDDARRSQPMFGTLPDGGYDSNDTKIEYCCRNDGDAHEAILLPSTRSFFLLKFGDTCQQVEGMDVIEEWIFWSEKKSVNHKKSEGGLHPTIVREENPVSYTKVFYCYFVPKEVIDTTNEKKSSLSNNSELLKILFVLGAVLGILFLFAALLYRASKNSGGCEN